MCGIVGIINSNNLKIKAINVLSKLEYRGYDSAGVSFLAKNKIKTITEVGKISELSKSLTSTGYNAFDSVIGHTRWLLMVLFQKIMLILFQIKKYPWYVME